MARPTKYASLICAITMVLALIGIIIGLIIKSPLVIIIFLLPAVGYEVYRTQGESTIWASWAILVVFLAEIVLMVFNISYNLAKFMGQEEAYVGGHYVPLGDIKVFGPILMAILAVILFIRTRGIYTKWLAAIIFVTSFVIVYTMNPESFAELSKSGIRQIFWYF